MDLAAEYTPSGQGSIGMCCCGRADCAFRTHSCEVLQDYEKDARVAAELGQVSRFTVYCIVTRALRMRHEPRWFRIIERLCNREKRCR